MSSLQSRIVRFAVTVAGLTSALSPLTVAGADLITGSKFGGRTPWTGYGYTIDGKFSYCAVYAVYGSTTLVLGMEDQFGQFMVSLGDPSWSLPQGQKFYATMSVDGKFGGKYEGLALTSSLITFSFKADPDFVKSFATGKTVHIVTSKQAWHFNLVGTEIIIPQMLQCVLKYGANGNPFDTKPQDSPPVATPKVANPFDSSM